MKRAIHRWRWLAGILFAGAMVLAGVVFWFADVRPFAKDRIFRGKPESEWIAALKYWDDDQEKEWREYGEEGIDVLLRGLMKANLPGERAYRKMHRKVPAFAREFLPEPKMDSLADRRHCIVALLSAIGQESARVVPVMIETAWSDESAGIRQTAIGYFITAHDDKTLGNRLPLEQKTDLLPALLRAVENGDSGNHNAVVLLRYFGEFSGMIEPTLIKALKDPKPSVRAYAAEALNRVAPDIANQAGATEVLIEVANEPDDQIASRAVDALGRATNRLDLAVPALLKSLESTNTLVACSAVWALEWASRPFEAHGEEIVSALEVASERKDNVGGYAKIAATRWQERLRKN